MVFLRLHQRRCHPLIQLPRIGALAHQLDEGAWIEIVVNMQEVQLLPYHAQHPGQGCTDRVGFGDASLRIQDVREAAPDSIGAALHT
jgi:hypothetical protein